jgi:hypothetical protein
MKLIIGWLTIFSSGTTSGTSRISTINLNLNHFYRLLNFITSLINIKMCMQKLDQLTFKGRIFPLNTYPMSQYWSEQTFMAPKDWRVTSNYRGYYSSWEIVDDSLYLTDLSYCTPNGYESLNYVFPGATGKIKATWYTGELELYRSRKLWKIYDELDRLRDPDWVISIENGNYIGQCYKLKTDYIPRKPIRELLVRLVKKTGNFK